jgi:hypothetical protein
MHEWPLHIKRGLGIKPNQPKCDDHSRFLDADYCSYNLLLRQDQNRLSGRGPEQL